MQRREIHLCKYHAQMISLTDECNSVIFQNGEKNATSGKGWRLGMLFYQCQV